MPIELTNVINLFKDNFIIVLLIFLVVFYLLISLLTWDFKKPLFYLGISNVVVGIVVIIIRFLLNGVTNFIPSYITFVDDILPTVLKPLLISGIVCLGIGILMIIIYYVILKIKNKKVEVK